MIKDCKNGLRVILEKIPGRVTLKLRHFMSATALEVEAHDFAVLQEDDELLDQRSHLVRRLTVTDPLRIDVTLHGTGQVEDLAEALKWAAAALESESRRSPQELTE